MSGQRAQDIPSEPRAAFMARVRAALGRTTTPTPTQEPPAVDDFIVRLVGAGSNLAETFAERAIAVGMRVHRTTPAACGEILIKILRDCGAKRLVSSLDSSLQTAPLQERLVRERFEFINWRGTPGFAAQYDADAGLTGVEAAVADSGTIVCSSGPGRGRGMSLVPPLHIAVVHESQIVPDLIDYWKSVPSAARDLPSSLVLITGPSKTADIEGVLITGVHGPREVHVVLVRET